MINLIYNSLLGRQISAKSLLPGLSNNQEGFLISFLPQNSSNSIPSPPPRRKFPLPRATENQISIDYDDGFLPRHGTKEGRESLLEFEGGDIAESGNFPGTVAARNSRSNWLGLISAFNKPVTSSPRAVTCTCVEDMQTGVAGEVRAGPEHVPLSFTSQRCSINSCPRNCHEFFANNGIARWRILRELWIFLSLEAKEF